MITVVTVTFNNFSELEATLNSIPQEDYIQSIVINGGNCPETIELLKRHWGKSISEKDNGIADAFNKGIIHSDGNAVMFINSGDILLNPEYLKQAADILETSDYDFVHSNLLLQDSIGGNLLMKPKPISLGRGLPYLHPTMIFKKEIFERIGCYDTSKRIAMDFDFVVRMKKKGMRGFYIDGDPIVKMEGTGTSIINEWAGIKECYASLKENNFLSIKNFIGFTNRVLFFLGRNILVKIGARKLLRKLKRIKRRK